MSATLLDDRSASSAATAAAAGAASSDTDYLAPVVPLRHSAPAGPLRPVRPSSAPPVSRRAGSRGARYAPTASPGGWHLSRRGELLLRRVTAAVTAAVVTLVAAAAVFAVVRAAGTSPMQTRTVSVQPGQSLWQVAAATSPSADVSDTADEIRSLNHLDGTTLTPGQILVVPLAR